MNVWDICLLVSVVFLIVCIVGTILHYAKRRLQKKELVSHYVINAIHVVFSAIFWFYPAYYTDCGETNGFLRFIKTVINSTQHTIRLFAGDDNYSDIMDILHPEKEEFIKVFWLDQIIDSQLGVELNLLDHIYKIIGELLFLIAPIFTFLFILSFFKNLIHFIKYKSAFCRDAHIFSELNEKSLELAKSIYQEYNAKNKERSEKNKKKKVSIVFADILDKNEEAHLDLVDGAKEIGAILFRMDMESINFNNWPIFRKIKRSLNFYLISYDESEKIRHAGYIIKNYNDSCNWLRFFSNSQECKYFLKPYENDPPKINILRLDDIRFLMYQFFRDHGIELLETAQEKNGLQTVHATIVGFGKYGIEALKALLWYCQLPGYKIDITVLDMDKEAENKFKYLCPELKINTHHYDEGDMRYYIEFKQCTFGTKEFAENVKQLPSNSCIFVCLGQDSLNISACEAIACLRAQSNKQFKISPIIYNSTLCNMLSSSDFWVFGNLEKFYSYKILVENDLIDIGFEVHTKWDRTNDKLEEFKKSKIKPNVENSEKTEGDEKTDEDKKSKKKKPDKKALKEERKKAEIAEKEATARMEKKRAEYYVNEYNFYSSFSCALHSECRKSILSRIGNNPWFELFKTSKTMENATVDDRSFWYNYLLNNTSSMEKVYALKDELDYIMEAPLGDENPSVKALLGKGIDDFTDAEKKRITDTLQKYEIEVFNTFDRLYAICKYAANIDHIRWNAYMRTEGFVFGPQPQNKEEKQKAKIAKTHHNLVPVSKLTLADCYKDI